jgi:ribonuclease P protein component
LTFKSLRVILTPHYEKDLSTARKKEAQNTRLPRQAEHKGRQKRTQEKNCQGKIRSHGWEMEKVAFESNNSFPTKFKIKTPRDFRSTLSEGTKTHSENFILYAKPNSLGFPRLGVSVGKKASASSVRRNRMKRVLREVFRRNKPAFSSNDVVFVIKNDVSGKKFSELYLEIKKLAGRIK